MLKDSNYCLFSPSIAKIDKIEFVNIDIVPYDQNLTLTKETIIQVDFFLLKVIKLNQIFSF